MFKTMNLYVSMYISIPVSKLKMCNIVLYVPPDKQKRIFNQ